jgi:hypothetical protein
MCRSLGNMIHVIMDAETDNMIRTQISLDENEYRLAKQEASALGISVAELVRRAIRQMLPVKGVKPWMRYAGFVESGDRHSGQNVDEVVYGSKR